MSHTFRDLITTATAYRKAIRILQADDRDQTVSIRILQNKLNILMGV